MFKKLLSNLPFNPSLIGQVTFYAGRLHREERVRRSGFVLVVLAMLLQLFAVVSPAEPSLARAGNDIIPGGFTKKNQAVDHCNSNDYDFRTVLDHFGVSCSNLASSNTTFQRIRSTDYNRKLLSIGHQPYGKVGERKIVIGGQTYYQRYLWSWDSGPFSEYPALVGTRSNGTPFMVLYDCGNITVVETPPPAPPAPTPPAPTTSIACSNLIMSIANGGRVEKDSSVSVRGQATGKNLKTSSASVDMHYDVINIDTGKQFGTTQIARAVRFSGSTATDSTNRTFKFTQTGRYRLRLAVKYNSGTKSATGNQTGNCIKQVNVAVTDVCPYKDGNQTNESECDVCPYIPGTQTDTVECKPCEDSTNNDDTTSCLDLSKSAKNDTQNLPDANNTTAKPNDIITYNLYVKNNAKTTAKAFVVEENLLDVLEYADVIDLHGGTMDEAKVVRWPAVDIAAGATLTKQITVKVKAQIPETPIATSNPGSYDLVMNNVYGNAINIKLPPTIAKTTEQVATTLPNTGPGTTLAISVSVAVIAGYFVSRSRLLAKELDIVREDYVASGGY